MFEIEKMGMNDGCTYKVFSKCSWPKLVANSSDVNIMIASFSDGPEGSDDIANDKWT